MRRPLTLATLSTVAFLVVVEGRPAQEKGVSAERVKHSLNVALDPTRGWLTVSDELTLPAGPSGPGQTGSLGMKEFLLHAGLKITASDPTVSEVALGDSTRFFGINSGAAQVPLKRYRVAVPAAGGAVPPALRGEVRLRPLRPEGGVHARLSRHGRDRPKDGVYLAGSGFWYPHVGPGLVE